jgi:YggT family protein
VVVILYALEAYRIILIIRIILSWTTMFWTPPEVLAPAVRVVYDLTEPVMAFFRRFIPPIGGLDLSPIFIFIILSIIQGELATRFG